MNPLGNQGPRNGNEARRSRNTLVNNASKHIARVSSAGAVGYGSQLAAARYQYLSQLAQLKAQAGLVKANRLSAVAEARAAMPGQIAMVEQDATERGVLGSSYDLQQRAAAVAARTGAINAANAEAAAARLGIQSGRMDARGQYAMTQADVLNQMYQEMMANTISGFAADQFDGGPQQSNQDVPSWPPVRGGSALGLGQESDHGQPVQSTPTGQQGPGEAPQE